MRTYYKSRFNSDPYSLYIIYTSYISYPGWLAHQFCESTNNKAALFKRKMK